MEQKRRRFVVLDEERDVANTHLEFGNPEDLHIAMEEEEQQRKINQNMDQLVNAGLFEELTDLQQLVILFRFVFEGGDPLTAQNIADALGLSRKTVYTRLNEAIDKLRANLKDNPSIKQRLNA